MSGPPYAGFLFVAIGGESLANNPSALKRWRQSLRRRAHNKPIRTRARSADRAARRLNETGDSSAAADALRQAQAALDGAAQKGG
jgi:small subunit ribosomal protein S20